MTSHYLLPAAAVVLAASFACSAKTPPPTSSDALIEAVPRAAPAAREPMMDQFIAEHGGTPIIEGTTVTFLVKLARGTTPRIVGDFNLWGAAPDGGVDPSVGAMTRIDGTGWWWSRTTLLPKARVEYVVADDTRYTLDERNPHRVFAVAGDHSEVRMPGYILPEAFDENAPRGTEQEADFKSVVLAGRRHIVVYTPAGYDEAVRYPIAFVHDGSLVLHTGHASRLLDALIAARRIAPLVAVFIDPESRNADYQPNTAFGEFLRRELLPWINTRYSIDPRPSRHAVVGLSQSTVAAIDEMRRYPDAFGVGGLLIPAVSSPKPDMAHPFARRSGRRFVVVAAQYDSLLVEARTLRRELTTAGVAVNYEEVPEGHDTETWRSHLGAVFMRLFAINPTDVK